MSYILLAIFILVVIVIGCIKANADLKRFDEKIFKDTKVDTDYEEMTDEEKAIKKKKDDDDHNDLMMFIITCM